MEYLKRFDHFTLLNKTSNFENSSKFLLKNRASKHLKRFFPSML